MIVFNDPEHGDEIACEAGTSFNPAVDRCIARVEDGRLQGGVVYTAYTEESIAMHTAGFRPTWVNRDMLWVCFHYPFVQLNCARIFGQVPETNRRALEFNTKLGFKVLTKIPGVFRDGGVYVISMERNDCRWLQLKPSGVQEAGHGRQEQGSPSPGLHSDCERFERSC